MMFFQVRIYSFDCGSLLSEFLSMTLFRVQGQCICEDRSSFSSCIPSGIANPVPMKVLTLFQTNVLRCLILEVIAIISIGMLSDASGCKMFIESYKFRFYPTVVCNDGMSRVNELACKSVRNRIQRPLWHCTGARFLPPDGAFFHIYELNSIPMSINCKYCHCLCVTITAESVQCVTILSLSHF